MAIPFQQQPRKRPDLAEIEKLIAWLGGDEAGIQVILAQLAMADWSSVLARVAPEIARYEHTLAVEEAMRDGYLICGDCQQRYPYGSSPGPGCAACAAKRKEAWEREPIPCEHCFQLCPRNQLGTDKGLAEPLCRKACCPSCLKTLRAQFTYTCPLCSAEHFLPQDAFNRAHLCPDCVRKDRRKEPGRLAEALRRARAAGTPATLTLQEWIDILDFFDGWCAYCQQTPYTLIEHFIPIVHGGGTTADNCVPACHGCNASKTDRHPDHLHSEEIKRVRAYLTNKQQGNAA